MGAPPSESIPDLASTVALGQGADVRARAGRNDAASEEWRDELAARLSRYRTRRKAPPPRYPSLKLPFDAVPRNSWPENSSLAAFEPVSNHALALHESAPPRMEVSPPEPSSAPPVYNAAPTAKIIEFPRFGWAPPPPPLDQLAEPVCEKPRILDVPEFELPAPALGGITIERLESDEPEKRPGIDFPLQSAPLARRLFATLVDGTIIAAASALFGFIFWKIAAVRPPNFQSLTLAAGIPFTFWVVYQYLLIVYSSSTPGLRAAGLELTRFDGSPTTRSRRRWRILASYLSALSLGMGYAWLFLDEDALCWHDRITHTYLAPRKKLKNSER